MKTRRQFRKRWGRAFQVEETSRERERRQSGREKALDRIYFLEILS